MRRRTMRTLKCPCIYGVVLLAGLATSVGGTLAAETGTKTMPDSSVSPPNYHRPNSGYNYHRPLYNYSAKRRYRCDLPGGRCY